VKENIQVRITVIEARIILTFIYYSRYINHLVQKTIRKMYLIPININNSGNEIGREKETAMVKLQILTSNPLWPELYRSFYVDIDIKKARRLYA
tara:strand:- start:150 stop:431 length:282 start_codon:yes stop_codon:yes gene_type:complete